MDPAILLIIIFIVAPLIERLLKAGKQGSDAPQPRERERIPRQRPQQRQPDERVPPQGRLEEWEREREQEAPPRVVLHRPEPGDEEAAAMLPDDLWEILTGEQRTPRRPSFPQAPADLEEPDIIAHEPALEIKPGSDVITSSYDDVIVPPEAAYVRPIPTREPPRVVSLEAVEIDSKLRHEQFHSMLGDLSAPARVQRAALNSYRFTSREDLRRAIVTAEILGTPKGLE